VSRRTRAEQARSGGVVGVDDEETLDLPGLPDALPEELVLRSARQQTLWQHVRSLPDRCRQLVGVIAFADRPDYAAIAESLGMPVGSIGPTRGRCLAKLRDALARDPRWEGLAT
jgi:DNA-directed RNA polymerase specialized sigma24 family protein